MTTYQRLVQKLSKSRLHVQCCAGCSGLLSLVFESTDDSHSAQRAVGGCGAVLIIMRRVKTHLRAAHVSASGECLLDDKDK